MKLTSTIGLIAALAVSGIAVAQMNGMSHDHASMPGMQHGDAASASMHGDAQKAPVHQAAAVVKAVNPAKGSVTLAHEAIQSLKWPAMTMGFVVKDKKLFDKLAVGGKVNVEFVQQGSDYVVTAVK